MMSSIQAVLNFIATELSWEEGLRHRLHRIRKNQAPPRQIKGFHVGSLRWIVERTFAWLDNARVLCRDYEILPENHEGMICVVMIRLMLRRLGNNRQTIPLMSLW